MSYRFILYFLILFSLCLSSCRQAQERLVVFHAGSLAVPFQTIAREYEILHPGTEVQLESAGSLTCIRKITELHKACDVLAVADYTLIDELMIPGYTGFNILFASNEMAIGYLPDSKWDGKITANNWMHLMLRDDVHFGRSDPDHDPSGYRTEIVAGLAEKLFQSPGFREELLGKDRRYIRPKGTELLPLLETGAIDFVFHYHSVLQQHKLAILPLPDSLNLHDPSLDEWYASACTVVKGTGSEQRISKCGEAMVYGICLPNTGANPSGAKQFTQFILTRGRQILEDHGQPAIKPSISSKSTEIPKWYSSLIKLPYEKSSLSNFTVHCPGANRYGLHTATNRQAKRTTFADR
jgi:molybdate/tungstate transport system substrate-binding protein